MIDEVRERLKGEVDALRGEINELMQAAVQVMDGQIVGITSRRVSNALRRKQACAARRP